MNDDNSAFVLIAGSLCVIIFLLMMLCACVSPGRYRRDIRRFYKDGFRMGRLIGSDETLDKLTGQGCKPKTSVSVDNIMNPDENTSKGH